MAALKALAVVGAELFGALELNALGCINTFNMLLLYEPLRDAASEAIMAIAKHMPDLVVMTNGLPKLCQALPYFSPARQRQVVAFLHALRSIHGAGLSRAGVTVPLVNLAHDASTKDTEQLMQILEVVETAAGVDPARQHALLSSSGGQAVLADLATHGEERVRRLASRILTVLQAD